MSETNASELSKERQFLRNARVIIKNFKKEEKIIFGNEFEIEFEYFKTIDQTKEDDSGSVTIYGLSDETIALLEEEGGEIWLDCGYEQSYVGNLFIAYISRVYTQVSNNITATTLECSANLLTHFFSGYAVSDESSTVTLMGLLENLSKSLGYPAGVFLYDNIPEDKREDVAKFVSTYKTNSYNIGSLRAIIDEVTDYYGLNFSRQLVDDVDSAVFTFTDLGLKKALKKIEQGYPAIDVFSTENRAYYTAFHKTLTAIEELRSGFVLTKDTGLIESQAEYQIVTAFLDQQLSANEIETAESFYKRNNVVDKTPDDEANEPTENTDTISTISSYSNSGEGFVSNSTLSGLTIKGGIGGQATYGGKVRGYTADFAKVVSDVVGSDLIRFTGFNDKFHVGKSSNHNQGQAFDLTIRSAHAGAPNQKRRIEDAARKQGFRITVLDEYNKPSSKATAPHLHVSVYGRTGANNSPVSDNIDTDKRKNQDGKDNYGRTTIEVNRRYNRIVALLNPAVKPQSLIFTKDKNSEDYLIHRVRHASFKGNNKRGEWTMTLYCEDTETGRITGNKVETTPVSTDLADTSVLQE